ncbi:MAG: hypothetical protein LLG20_21115 [Acidobacteriales bacterium]|nr:hypothetical protein [Terriglobales bacterium]
MNALTRRQFAGLAGAALEASAAGLDSLEAGGWRAQVDRTGAIVSLQQGGVELVNRRLGSNHPRVTAAGAPAWVCDKPLRTRREGRSAVYEYRVPSTPEITVRYEVSIEAIPNGAALIQRIAVHAASPLSGDVTVELPRNIHLPTSGREVFLPLENGIGRRRAAASTEGVYQLTSPAPETPYERLAIPAVDEFSSQTDLRILFASDPWFTSDFHLPADDRPGSFRCTYFGKLGLANEEQRTVVTALHKGGFDGAMRAFYTTCLKEVREGPPWVHDVAMIGYDFLSGNGRGWFADIDELERLIRPADREKVLLALHGWYDYIGRYAFNYRSRSLDKTWKAFPCARLPEVQALAKAPDPGLKWGVGFHRNVLEKTYPVDMSWPEMQRRVRYAKNKGFRVAVYFADGILACDGVKETFDPSRVLRWGGWRGPEVSGKPYAQNPLHPDVRGFYLAYVDALLGELGRLADAFIWDETFYVKAGDLGNEAYPGYAGRAMMHLVRDVARRVAAAGPNLALFSSDNLGPGRDKTPPTALAAHGTYQDSSSQPQYWPYGLFSNYRNNLWSCNWYPITGFALTKYAADTFDTPVTISNGYGDGVSLPDIPPDTRKQFLDLFNERKQRRQILGWLEEKDGVATYRGKPMRSRRELMGA